MKVTQISLSNQRWQVRMKVTISFNLSDCDVTQRGRAGVNESDKFHSILVAMM